MPIDSKYLLGQAIRYLSEAAKQRAAGGWVPPKEEERRFKEQARAEEKHQRETERHEKEQNKLLSKQFPTHYMPNVGRQVMNTGGVPDDQPQRQLSPLGFYSAAAERAQTLQPSGDAVQMINALKNTQGIKTEELQNAGLIDAAGNVHPEWAGRGKVTREDLVSHLQGQMPQVEETVLGYGSKSDVKWSPEDEKRLNYLTSKTITGEITFKEMDEKNKLFKMQQQFLAKGIPSKYEQYTLPGGENYREVLLKLPETKAFDPQKLKVERKQESATQGQAVLFYDGEKMGTFDDSPILNPQTGRYEFRPESYWQSVAERRFTGDPIAGIKSLDKINYRSPHWDDPNVLAHIRMSDRAGPNGEKILHVEELQSDWGQKGKKEGFKSDKATIPEGYSAKKLTPEESKHLGYDYVGYDPNGMPILYGNSELDIANSLTNYVSGKSGAMPIPVAPYVTSTEGWTDLALKRVLKEAAEGGYDKVVWTPGAEQAKRYDLSKQISKLTLEDGPRGEQMLRAYGPSGDQVISRHIIDAEKEIPDLVGKDVAQKLLSQEPVKPKVFRTNLSPSDIKVTPLENRYKIESGEGWSSHVGNRVVGSADEAAEYAVKYFNQLAKEANNKVAIQGPYRALEGQDLSVGGEGMKGYYDSIVPKRLQNLAKKYDKNAKLGYTETHHRGQVSNAPMSYTLPSLDITPAMRESILRGQSAYQRGGTVSKKHPALSIPGIHIREEEHGEPIFTGRL